MAIWSSVARRLALAIALVSMFAVQRQAHAITITTVPVVNAGNPNDDSTGYGGVNYEYEIAATEVTNDQYVAFLNAKASSSDPLGLYNANMASDPRGGIIQVGSPGSYTYSAKANMGNKPVNYASWYDAIRFANWLNNGQGSASTETGAYTILGGTPTPTDGLSITRNSGATWFLTSENEWYKAAYYEPGASSNDYWLYPTRSDSAPTKATANATGDINNPGANVANYDFGADWNSQDGNVTTVGSAGSISQSFYGTFDQGGNVWEWNEALIVTDRGSRGGSFDILGVSSLASGAQNAFDPTLEDNFLGFRVATVPEPCTAVLCIAGCVGAWMLRRRFR